MRLTRKGNMSWRTILENKYTVICLGCKNESIDFNKKPNQKYPKCCSNCNRTNIDNIKINKTNKVR